MKKTGLYIFSFCCLLVYVLSLNHPFMEWWAAFRTYKLHAAYSKARYGDLYSNCFLPGYIDTAYIPLKKHAQEKANTDLYLIHDSYLDHNISKENFTGLNKLVTVDYRDAGLYVKPDVTKRNILIIECSERTADWRLADTGAVLSKINLKRPVPSMQDIETNGKPFMSYLFNPLINQNLEFSLYDYEYFIPIKNAKAQINYSLFNRLPKEVVVSSDQKYLLLNETVDPFSGASSFIPLDPARLNYVTNCVNSISAYYKARGFAEVYFSIIPNPVSILDPLRMEVYNHKIELLENNASLNASYISVYYLFKNSPQRIYRTDDSHWNGNGLQLWVDEVNKRIEP